MNKLFTLEHRRARWILLAISLIAYTMCFTSCSTARQPYTGCYVGKKLTAQVDTTQKKTGHGAGAKQTGAINI